MILTTRWAYLRSKTYLQELITVVLVSLKTHFEEKIAVARFSVFKISIPEQVDRGQGHFSRHGSLSEKVNAFLAQASMTRRARCGTVHLVPYFYSDTVRSLIITSKEEPSSHVEKFIHS